MSTAEFDVISKARHYNVHPSGVECIDVIRHLVLGLGNTVKYLWRADEKGSRELDIGKALYFLRDEIRYREENGGSHDVALPDDVIEHVVTMTDRFCAAETNTDVADAVFWVVSAAVSTSPSTKVGMLRRAEASLVSLARCDLSVMKKGRVRSWTRPFFVLSSRQMRTPKADIANRMVCRSTLVSRLPTANQ